MVVVSGAELEDIRHHNEGGGGRAAAGGGGGGGGDKEEEERSKLWPFLPVYYVLPRNRLTYQRRPCFLCREGREVAKVKQVRDVDSLSTKGKGGKGKRRKAEKATARKPIEAFQRTKFGKQIVAFSLISLLLCDTPLHPINHYFNVF